MRIIFFLLTITASQLYGINSDSLKNYSDSLNNYKKWNIGVSFSPDYSYRILSPLKSNIQAFTDNYNQCADSLNILEKPTISWTAGIPVTYHFSKFISIKTGFYFSNKTFKSKGFVYGNGVYWGWNNFKSNKWGKSDFIFLEVPIALEYSLRPKKLKKFNFSAWGGITICSNLTEHYYNSRRWMMDYQHPELESSYSKLYIDKFKLLYLGYTAGVKVTYKLNKKFILGLEPTYKFYGKEFVSTSILGASNSTKTGRQTMPITEKPYSWGINLSLEFTR